MSLTVHINSLPDLVLRRIFSKVPLLDLLYADCVCPLWKYYQVEAAKKVRSLTLLIGPTDTQSLIANSCFTFKYHNLLLNDDGTRVYSSQHLPEHFHLTSGSFTSKGAAKLLSIFPHITTLEIAIKFAQGQYLLNPIQSLLSQWSPMLKTLKMYFQFTGNGRQENWFVHLFKVINSMQSLEHLTLDSDTHIFAHESMHMHFNHFNLPDLPGLLPVLPNSIDLPILGHLREFYCRTSDHVNIIEKFLLSYAVPNENLRQIGLDYTSVYMIASIFKRFPQLANKIVYLSLYHPASSSTQLENITQLFDSITKLILVNSKHFRISEKLSKDALSSMSSLRQLEHLHVDNYNQDFFASNKISLDQFSQLASVQVLTITTDFEPTSIFESNHWAHLFPNVQVIELAFTIMTIDGLNLTSKQSKQRSSNLSKQQLIKSLSPFVQCPKLHHIFTCEKYKIYRLGGIEHSLPEMFKEWILLQVNGSKIINQVEK